LWVLRLKIASCRLLRSVFFGCRLDFLDWGGGICSPLFYISYCTGVQFVSRAVQIRGLGTEKR